MSATISPTRAARQATDLDSHRLPLLWVGFVAASLITGAIKWGDANFAFAQLRRLRAHTPWPPP
jgi:hypothetical protein